MVEASANDIPISPIETFKWSLLLKGNHGETLMDDVMIFRRVFLQFIVVRKVPSTKN